MDNCLIVVHNSSNFSKRGFTSTWTENFQMFKLDLEKAEEPEIKLPANAGSSKKQESSRKKKNLLLLYWLWQRLWLCESQETVENSSRVGNTRPRYLLLRNLYAGQEATIRTGHGTMENEVAQSYLTLCDPMDLPVFSIHGILQARILKWVAISFSRGSSRPRDQTRVSCVGGRHFNLEQWTGSKLGKEYIKAVYCHPAYLAYMQNTSCEMPDWMKLKL